MLKRRKECVTYLTHICRHRRSGENPVKRFKIELSANIVAFITVEVDSSIADESHSASWKLLYLFTRFPPLQ